MQFSVIPGWIAMNLRIITILTTGLLLFLSVAASISLFCYGPVSQSSIDFVVLQKAMVLWMCSASPLLVSWIIAVAIRLKPIPAIFLYIATIPCAVLFFLIVSHFGGTNTYHPRLTKC